MVCYFHSEFVVGYNDKLCLVRELFEYFCKLMNVNIIEGSIILLVVKGLPRMIHCEIFNSMALLNQTHLVPTLYLDKISHRIKSVVGEGS